ncbi:DUF1345 domain-containing protein [Nigerium massiliense]|uniref:DUF1345 domain-containing protein n=1 Tax=Nigerium massiliense TaxID=1522317 RepID=UPI00058F6ED4|nr:DUF1345 domain-containing protein [Nigerium massiliense]
MNHRQAVSRLLTALVAGAVTLPLVLWGGGGVVLAIVAAWTVLALTYCAVTWHALAKMPPDQTKEHAITEEAGRHGTNLVLTLAALASVAGVGVLLQASSSQGPIPWEALVGTSAVASSWMLIHVIYTTRYADLYYQDAEAKPIDFGDDQPDYQDFAYLAFTLGMTYQVSDTDLKTRRIRRAVLRHSLLSYALGAVVIASTINLVAQLASSGGGH